MRPARDSVVGLSLKSDDSMRTRGKHALMGQKCYVYNTYKSLSTFIHSFDFISGRGGSML